MMRDRTKHWDSLFIVKIGQCCRVLDDVEELALPEVVASGVACTFRFGFELS